MQLKEAIFKHLNPPVFKQQNDVHKIAWKLKRAPAHETESVCI